MIASKHGLHLNRIMPALFYIRHKDRQLGGWLGTRVGGLLRDVHPQDAEYTVTVSAEDNIKKIEPVSYPESSQLARERNEGETFTRADWSHVGPRSRDGDSNGFADMRV